MKITWTLYEEDGLDAEDPLGSIEITEGDGDGIRQAATYIDSWFQALLQGARSLSAGEEESIEMLEEPDPLEFSVEGSRLKIRHDQSALDCDLIEAMEEIRKEAGRFLLQMQTLDGWESNPTLQELDRVLSGE